MTIAKHELKLGSIITPQGFPEGRITTAEFSTLAGFITGVKDKKWCCWTVETSRPPPEHKYLLVDLDKDGILLWKPSNITSPPPDAQLWLDYCGIEEMENITGKEPSSFIYSMLSFVLDPKAEQPTKFYSMERLRNGDISHYEGYRVG